MSKILIDSSVWIRYFRSQKSYPFLNELIETNQICINDLILAELIPYLYIKNYYEVIESLESIERIEIKINWEMIIQMQITNIKNGINKVGISDLIILQNVIENNLTLFSIDKHFELMKDLFEYRLFEYT
ncbi:MAG: PIN domain-containing protein [Spirochaetota bacterium]